MLRLFLLIAAALLLACQALAMVGDRPQITPESVGLDHQRPLELAGRVPRGQGPKGQNIRLDDSRRMTGSRAVRRRLSK